MKVAQISDFHFTHITWNPLHLFSKRILGNLNWLLTRASSFDYERLSHLPQLFRELEVDLILIGGDLTSTSLQKEYEKAQDFIQTLPVKWLAVPGNHDHYTYASCKNRRFYRFFANPPPYSSHTLKEDRVELHRIAQEKGGNWWLLALDTSRATNIYSSQGLFSIEQERVCRELLNSIPPSDSVICLNHYPFFPQPSARRNLERKEALEALVKQFPQIRLYLQGHTHRHVIADLQESNYPILLDSGSCVQKGGTWNLIALMPDTCSVTAYSWERKRWTPTRQEQIPWKQRKMHPGIAKGSASSAQAAESVAPDLPDMSS